MQNQGNLGNVDIPTKQGISILNFTAEEINLIAIYKTDTQAATIENIIAACDDMLDDDIISIAENASYKLAVLTDTEFSSLIFTSADETEAEPNEIDYISKIDSISSEGE